MTDRGHNERKGPITILKYYQHFFSEKIKAIIKDLYIIHTLQNY